MSWWLSSPSLKGWWSGGGSSADSSPPVTNWQHPTSHVVGWFHIPQNPDSCPIRKESWRHKVNWEKPGTKGNSLLFTKYRIAPRNKFIHLRWPGAGGEETKWTVQQVPNFCSEWCKVLKVEIEAKRHKRGQIFQLLKKLKMGQGWRDICLPQFYAQYHIRSLEHNQGKLCA